MLREALAFRRRRVEAKGQEHTAAAAQVRSLRLAESARFPDRRATRWSARFHLRGCRSHATQEGNASHCRRRRAAAVLTYPVRSAPRRVHTPPLEQPDRWGWSRLPGWSTYRSPLFRPHFRVRRTPELRLRKARFRAAICRPGWGLPKKSRSCDGLELD